MAARKDIDPAPAGSGLVDQSIRIAAIALLLYWSFLLVQPFLAVIAWAVILAITAYPVFHWLEMRLGDRQVLAASLVTLMGLLVVVAPVGVLGQSIAGTVSGFYAKVEAGEPVLAAPAETLGAIPLVGDRLLAAWKSLTTDFEAFLSTYAEQIHGAGQFLLSKATGLGLDIAIFVAAQFLAGYLLVAGPGMAAGARRLLERADPGGGAAYAETIAHTVRNVAIGAVGVALLQAILGGLTMLAFGVESAGVLALVALGLGVIQIGVGVVFTPVAIIGLFTMDPWHGVPMAVILIGLTVIDNYLKPLVMGKGLDTPMLVVLFGLLGGVALHGFIGIFVGPVVLTVVHGLVKAWVGRPA